MATGSFTIGGSYGTSAPGTGYSLSAQQPAPAGAAPTISRSPGTRTPRAALSFTAPQPAAPRAVTTIHNGSVITTTDRRLQEAASRNLSAMQAADRRCEETIRATQRSVDELMAEGLAPTLAAGYETIRQLEEELAMRKANREAAKISQDAEIAELQQREKELNFKIYMANGWLDSADYFVRDANKNISEYGRKVCTHEHCFMTSHQRGMECHGPIWR